MIGEFIVAATVILLIIISLFLFNGKVSWYKTASKEKKIKYDKICNVAGCIIFLSSVMLCFMKYTGYMFNTEKVSKEDITIFSFMSIIKEKMIIFSFWFIAVFIIYAVIACIYNRYINKKVCIKKIHTEVNEENINKKEERKIDMKNAKFKFILTDENIRKRMFEFYGFDRHHYNPEKIEHMNINWAYGVYDEVNGIFITVSSIISDCIARCDIDFYDYLVLTDFVDEFIVTNNKLYKEGRYDFKSNGHHELEDLIKKGIEVYNDSSLKYEFEKEVSEKIGKSYQYNSILKSEMYEK